MRSVLSIIIVLVHLPLMLMAKHGRCGSDYIRSSPFSVSAVPTDFRFERSTADTQSYVLPVVFHIVLTRLQIEKLGGEPGIRAYIETQLALMNDDFCGTGADSTLIPPAFKNHWGKAKIRFQLAHKKPDGTASEGYEILVTDKKGFNLDGDEGSGFAFSGLKHAVSGGFDGWDNMRYINIWIANLLEENFNSGYLGITIGPRSRETVFSDELGIVLSHTSWYDGFKGRILTHEMGHYFNLLHTWGNNDLCPGAGGEDDGLGDTPPQSEATYGCPSFPLLDTCSTGPDGIMFVNLMDYTDEPCQMMFTNDQAELMRLDLLPAGISYELTQQAELLQWPEQAPQNSFSLYPNPAGNYINIYFAQQPENLPRIRLYDIRGAIAADRRLETVQRFYYLDVSEIPRGIYILEMIFPSAVERTKIVLQ